MPLPILQSSTNPSAADLVRFFHQTERDWTRHTSEETPLDVGTAFHNADLGDVSDANGILDAALPEGMTPAAAVAEADSHFSAMGATCRRWVMNPSAPPDRTAPLGEYLRSIGYRMIESDIMHLAHMPTAPIREAGGLKVIPARASYKHARQLAEEAAAQRHGGTEAQRHEGAEARMMHLDDPHLDAVLALKDGQAVATVSVLAVGEIGRIDSLFVAGQFRRHGLGRTMMSRALEICARSLFKHVLLRVEPGNVAAIALFDQLGFAKIGEIGEYVKT